MNKLILEMAGDFHPLMVHFPIGIIILIGLTLLLSKMGKIELPLPFFRLINYFCLLSLIFSVLLGLASKNSRTYSGNDSLLLDWHKQLGFGTLSSFSLACFCLYFSDKNKNIFKWYLIFYLFSLGFLLVGGHLGNTIVHGEVKLIKILNSESIKKMRKKFHQKI